MSSLSTLRPRARMVTANALKTLAFHTGLHRMFFYRYDYMFVPSELCTMVSALTQTHGQSGPILEIGCAAGATTVFLNKHLDDLGDKREYFCIDTFAGFTQDDIEIEIGRGKDADSYNYVFKAYRKDWFDQTMKNNRIDRVESIQADANEFDFSRFEDISFCLIDVDLMRPVKRSLEEVIPRMASGGVIVVDDCMPDNHFDGALAGYLDVVKSHGFPVDIFNDMLGIIRIP